MADNRAEMQIGMAAAARALEKRVAALERLEFPASDNIMPVVSPAVAGNLVTQAADGTLADAGYAALVETAAGSVVRRGGSGEIAITNQNSTIGEDSTAIVAIAGVGGVAVQGSGDIAIEARGSTIGLKGISSSGSAASFGLEAGIPPTYAEKSNIAGEDGVLRFTGANAATNRAAQLAEIGGAAASDLTTHIGLTGAAVHGLGTASTLTSGATGAALVATATQADGRTALGLGTMSTATETNYLLASGARIGASESSQTFMNDVTVGGSGRASGETILLGIAALSDDVADAIVRLRLSANSAAGFSTATSEIDGVAEGNGLGAIVFNTRPGSGAALERVRINSSGRVGINSPSPAAQQHIISSSATQRGQIVQVAASATENAQEWRNSTPAAMAAMTQIGVLILGQEATTSHEISGKLKSSTTANTQAARVAWAWVVNTHATRTAALSLYASDYGGERIGVTVGANGTAAVLGFYGVTPTARQLLATGTGATVDQVITALQTLGLLKQS